MGISGNRSSTTNIYSSDYFGIPAIYTFWAIHPCKNNHLAISFRAVIVNSNLSNLVFTITALKMIKSLRIFAPMNRQENEEYRDTKILRLESTL